MVFLRTNLYAIMVGLITGNRSVPHTQDTPATNDTFGEWDFYT